MHFLNYLLRFTDTTAKDRKFYPSADKVTEF